MKRLWVPRDLRIAPRLDAARKTSPVRPRFALLINPFYPKDPHASFGKHVLTPSLALTSVAVAPFGARLAHRWPARRLRLAFAAMLAIVGVTMLRG